MEEAERRNRELIAGLRASGCLHDPAVAAAFEAVLRHHFLPGRPLEEAYEDTAVLTKEGAGGLPLSSASQPGMVALMLEQLGLEPGLRVLEVGAGTGYNAALMAHLVGPGGQVVTLDLDEDLCQAARRNLAAAGMGSVAVVRADGAAGWPAQAPRDRIIVTASVEDLAPAWLEGLVEGGRLVVPLALTRSAAQLSVAFERRGVWLRSRSVTPCGFLPMRGALAWSGETAPPPEVAAWLREPGRRTGGGVPAIDLRSGFALWLALTETGYARGRPDPAAPEAIGLADRRGLALLEGEGRWLELTVRGDGEAAAQRLLEVHRAWIRMRPSITDLRVKAAPTEAPPEPPEPGWRAIVRPNFTFLVSAL